MPPNATKWLPLLLLISPLRMPSVLSPGVLPLLFALPLSAPLLNLMLNLVPTVSKLGGCILTP